MPTTLKSRCAAFLKQKPPAELGYVGDSIAERTLQLCAAGEPIDGELLELLEIMIADSQSTAEGLAGAAREYLLTSAALLEEIVAAG